MANLSTLTPNLIRSNRRHLAAVPKWLPPLEQYRDSRYQYGIPESVLSYIDAGIDDSPTCTDVLTAVALTFGRPVRYLEVGVSVGKNLYCLTQALQGSTLCGLDWEDPNPVLDQLLAPRSTLANRLFAYGVNGNRVMYVQGDEFDPSTWQPLAHTRFDVIFSDACHRAPALRHEFEMISRFDLLNLDEFFIMWDDLCVNMSSPMTRAFRDICDSLRQRVTRPLETGLIGLNGWLGQHEGPHCVGFATTLEISRDRLVEAIQMVRQQAAHETAAWTAAVPGGLL